jgi:VCBS repeat-containing protein
MKKLYTLIILSVFMLTQIAFAQAPPEIIHYDFNGTGTLVTNLASSPPPGTATGTLLGTGLTIGGTGQCGGALNGTGTSGGTDYINTAWTTSLTGSWSIAFWTNSITPSSTLWYIFGDAAAGSFRCFTNGVASANNWLLRATGMTDMLITGGATTTAAHNAFVYDAAASQGRMYLNGVLQGTVAQSSSASFVGTGPFKVGAYATNSNLSGKMDEFRVYARALTNTEVAALAVGAAGSTTMNVTSCGSYTSPFTSTVYASTGVYTETYIACGGTNTVNLNLTVNPAPTITVAANPSVICSGTTVSLTATGSSTSYTWNTTGPNTSTLNVTPAATTIYTVAGNAGGCTVTRTISVGVTATPTIGVNSSANTICQNVSTTITASGATTYSWSTGATTNTISDTPLTNTVYMVSSSNGSCSSTNSIAITVNPSPTVTLVASSNTICSGNTITITASGANVYAWSSSSSTNAVITAAPANSTVYTVVGISNNCSDTKTIGITVNQTPVVSVSTSTSIACTGSMVTLTATGAATYSWSTGATTNPATVTPFASSVYTVTGTASNGCPKNATISIGVIASPTLVVVPSATAICTGDELSLTASGAFTYTWNTGAQGSVLTLTPTAGANYTVTGKGPNVCLGQTVIFIPVNAIPNVAANSNHQVMCKGESATITASGASTYSWSTSTSTASSLVVSPTTTKTYTVTGIDGNGCKMSVALTHTVSDCVGITSWNNNTRMEVYPNPSKGVFTINLPNSHASATLEIYNVTGQKIAEKESVNGAAIINLEGFASGIYYLKIKDSEFEPTKLIKE